MFGLQKTSSRTSANSTESRFTNIEKSLDEISKKVENHQIKATYESNSPQMKQDFTRFCTFSRKFGHKIKFCWSFQKKLNLMRKKQLLNRDKLLLKITRTDQNRQILTDRTRTIAVTPKEVEATVLTLQSGYSANIRFQARNDKVNSLYDTLQSCNPLN